MSDERIIPVYLIPFDSKYFLLGLTLLTNLKTYLKNFDNVFVIDFGFTKNQLDFLKEFDVNVIPLPQELVGAHPYKLKSNLLTFLVNSKLIGRWIVFLDADLLLLKTPDKEIDLTITQMVVENKTIAICQDMGPARSIGEFLNIFKHSTANFKRHSSNLDLSMPYLNIGFVIFSPHFDFYEFKNLSEKLEGDMCWEQNALNLMCMTSTSYLLLDAKKWNLHGSRLLDEYSDADDTYIIHLTSTSDNLIGAPYEFIANGITFKFYYRIVKNKNILKLQGNYLKKLVQENSGLFLKYFR